MSRKSKFSAEEKLAAIKLCLTGGKNNSQVAKIYGVTKSTIRLWRKQYLYNGIQGLESIKRNQIYSKEFKLQLVKKYLSGEGSFLDLAAKYGLRSQTQLKQWVIKYNSHVELKDYDPKSEVYMAASRRKTTQEERQEIVDWCLNHDKNYKLTAEKFSCSYAQVYNWVKKFISQGKDGLIDKRGHHKSEEELTELEKAEREIAKLKHQLKMARTEIEFSKKLQKLERELMLEKLKHK